MYYSEQVINGVLCFATSPDGPYKPYTAEQLTRMVIKLEKRIALLELKN